MNHLHHDDDDEVEEEIHGLLLAADDEEEDAPDPDPAGEHQHHDEGEEVGAAGGEAAVGLLDEEDDPFPLHALLPPHQHHHSPHAGDLTAHPAPVASDTEEDLTFPGILVGAGSTTTTAAAPSQAASSTPTFHHDSTSTSTSTNKRTFEEEEVLLWGTALPGGNSSGSVSLSPKAKKRQRPEEGGGGGFDASPSDGINTAATEGAAKVSLEVPATAPATVPAAPASTSGTYKVNTERWTTMFDRLTAYQRQYGHCLVPKRYGPDPKLGTFVETQRVQYKRLHRIRNEATGLETVVPNNRLTAERLASLDSIGFVWSAKTVKKGKDVAIHQPSDVEPDDAVPAVSEENGTLDGDPPPASDHDKKPPPHHTRKCGGYGSSSLETTVPAEDPWDQLYQRLATFRQLHGHCLVPRKYEADPRLARWVEVQRGLWNRDYNNNNNNGGRGIAASSLETDETSEGQSAAPGPSPMIPAAAAAVPQSDWTVVDDGTFFPTMAPAACETNVDSADKPEGPTDDACPLPAKRLSQERKDKLDALGFVWNLRSKRIDDHWEDMFQQLCEYRRNHGDCLVPSRYEHNPRLGKWVETQRYEYTKLQRASQGGYGSGGTIDFRNPNDGKPRAALRLTEERLQRLNEIGFEWKVKNKMKRYYDKQWDSMFQKLLQYKREQGHCLVPKRYPTDPKLGTWCHTQRIQYKKAHDAAAKRAGDGHSDPESEDAADKTDDDLSVRLTDERRNRLEAVGFSWTARSAGKAGLSGGKVARNSYDDQWDGMFNRLKEYKERFGHCLVPKRYKEDPKLGTWTDTQRSAYKKLKKLGEEPKVHEGSSSKQEVPLEADPTQHDKPIVGRLTGERIRRLESLGFVWSLRDDWNQHYEELKQFKLENGHCHVPARYETNKKLGIWVSSQRQQFKIMQTITDESTEPRRWGPLTKERIDLLNQLGFAWSIRSRDILGENWNQKLHELRFYRSVHGNCNVPSRYPDNPELGIWVGTQRTQYRLYMNAIAAGEDPQTITSMTEDRIQQLEGLGFVWTLRGDGKKVPQEDDSPMRGGYQEHDLETMSHGYSNEDFPPLNHGVLMQAEM